MAPAKEKANGAPVADDGSVGESPVIALLSKRLRNLRKRLRNAEEIQAKLDAGKELNADQVRRLCANWTCDCFQGMIVVCSCD
jgi:hypothetical protein